MVTNKFSSYSDKELQTTVEGLSNNTLTCTISELKELQSELINRRSEPQHIATVSHLIMKQISMGGITNSETQKMPAASSVLKGEEQMEQKGEISTIHQPKQPTIKPSVAKIDQIRPQPITKQEIEEDEKFPVLRFLVLFYKIIGWLGVAAILGGFTIVAIYMLQGNVPYILCGSGLSLVAAAMFLLIFTALSEGVHWKLEVEKHLRKDS